MTPATNDSLARAIIYLGAVEVAPGKYAWFDESQNGYRVASKLEQYHPDEEEGYATFCEAVNPVEMPSWWSPERRKVTKCDDCGAIMLDGTHPSPVPETWCADNEDVPEVSAHFVTADLETGAEVPC